MDGPDISAECFIDTLKGLGRVNFVTQSARLVWPDIRAVASAHRGRTIRVLDVACGGGDVMLTLWRRASRAGLKIEFDGCDISPVAIDYARRRAAHVGAPFRYFAHDVTGDALPTGYDIIMSNLFLHHLDDDCAVRFLHDAGEKARKSLIIQDLRRSALGYWFARLGTSFLLLNDVCRLDGQTSVEGAFSPAEARSLLDRAGLGSAHVVQRFPFRFIMHWVRP